jgi:acetyl-CoA carboxylase, biotin carboxylase subunit
VTSSCVRISGHSIECRINAENPETFTPTPGRLDTFVVPGGPWTRVDTHCYPGWNVSPFYDSLIAKLIVWAPERAQAVERMQRALGEFDVQGPGVKTTIPFHQRVFAHPVFRAGDFNTNFVEQHMLPRA